MVARRLVVEHLFVRYIGVVNEPFFSNRELASLILLLLGTLFALVLVASSRTEILRSFWSMFSSFVSPKVLIPVLLYVVWVLAALIPASRLGLWESGLWKTTLLWLLLSGFGLIFNLNDAIQKPRFVQQALVRAVASQRSWSF